MIVRIRLVVLAVVGLRKDINQFAMTKMRIIIPKVISRPQKSRSDNGNLKFLIKSITLSIVKKLRSTILIYEFIPIIFSPNIYCAFHAVKQITFGSEISARNQIYCDFFYGHTLDRKHWRSGLQPDSHRVQQTTDCHHFRRHKCIRIFCH